MEYIVFILLGAFLLGCQNQSTSVHTLFPTVGIPTTNPNCPNYTKVASGFYGGDGRSMDNAIEMVGAGFTIKRWVSENFPKGSVEMQVLGQSVQSKRKYSLATIKTVDGQFYKVWFWLSGGDNCQSVN